MDKKYATWLERYNELMRELGHMSEEIEITDSERQFEIKMMNLPHPFQVWYK